MQLSSIQRQPWGLEEMTLIDPFSNRIRFCKLTSETA
ncbi:MAG: glyoxalase superfamily protein [Hyphomicrobiaceae bacterium]